jgi:hypothetical protein
MADDRTKQSSQDRLRVNLSERYEVMYWTNKFAVPERELEAAVKAVGSSALAVEEYLQQHNRLK